METLSPLDRFVLEDELQADVLRCAVRRAAWARAMSDKGIKVKELDLTPLREREAIAAWEQEQATKVASR